MSKIKKLISFFFDSLSLIGVFFIIMLMIVYTFSILKLNFTYFNEIKEGEIIDINITRGDESNNIRKNFSNIISIFKEKDTLVVISSNKLNIGDSVKFRYLGENGGGKIFEVNGVKKYTKFDFSFYFSLLFWLILLLVLIFMTIKKIK